MASNDLSVPIDVDIARSTNGVWLVKVPKYLSKILDDYGDGTMNGEVGRLVRRPTAAAAAATAKGTTAAAAAAAAAAGAGARAQDVFFCLNDQILDKLREKNPSKDYQLPPREHQFCLSNVSDGVLRTVYTRTLANPNTSSGEQISLVGKVIQRAEVRPVENEQYMALKRKQFETFQEPTSRAQLIPKKINSYLPKRDHEENKQRLKIKQQMGKRVRSDEDVVLNRIFEAFTKHQYIPMTALETITQQPKNYLQQLVKKYCNYNSAGHTYELKPQYRHYDTVKEEGGGDDDDDDIKDDDDDDDDDDNNNINT